MTLRHLTDEQLTDHLSGVSLPAIDDHLAACEACRQEAASMRASFQVFHHASMEWSEARQNAAGSAPRFRPCCAGVASSSRLGGRLRSRSCSHPAVRRAPPGGKDFAVHGWKCCRTCCQRQQHRGT